MFVRSRAYHDLSSHSRTYDCLRVDHAPSRLNSAHLRSSPGIMRQVKIMTRPTNEGRVVAGGVRLRGSPTHAHWVNKANLVRGDGKKRTIPQQIQVSCARAATSRHETRRQQRNRPSATMKTLPALLASVLSVVVVSALPPLDNFAFRQAAMALPYKRAMSRTDTFRHLRNRPSNSEYLHNNRSRLFLVHTMSTRIANI